MTYDEWKIEQQLKQTKYLLIESKSYSDKDVRIDRNQKTVTISSTSEVIANFDDNANFRLFGVAKSLEKDLQKFIEDWESKRATRNWQ